MNFKILALIASVLLCTSPLFSQQITGKIMDAKTKEAIPFSTIQFDENNGVVSNAEGFYNLSIDRFEDSTTLTVSCLGYLTQSLTFKDLKSKKYNIALDEAVNQLSTVYISNKLPNVDSIMKRVQANLKQNYNTALTKNTIFSRQTAYFKPNKVEIEIDKSSGFNKNQLKESNRQLDSLTNGLVNSPPSQEFTDILAEYYNSNNNGTKLQVTKATKLLDIKNKSTFDNIQKKATNIILKHLDVNATYKLKTGLFKIEDSLSLKDAKKKMEEEKAPELSKIKQDAYAFLNQYLFGSSSLLDFVSDTTIYNYKIVDVTYMNGKAVYVIQFSPRKGRAKYTGNLYVVGEDYAIARIDYKFADGKKGESLNLKLLLGVKYAENVNTGTVIYRKNIATNYYYPYYINQEIGRYAYVHRPLKFIENGGDKDKIAFDFKLDGDIIEKNEVLNFANEAITEDHFTQIKENTTVEFIKLKQYDPSIWKNYTIMEPLEEMKLFRVKDE